MSRLLLFTACAVLLGAAPPAPASDLESLFPPPSSLEPLAPEGAAEIHTLETLWEKINGEAEIFRRFNLLRAGYQRYSLPADPDETLEVALYLLASPLDAFGLFAYYSPDDASPAAYGNGAFLEESRGALRHGPYFVIIESFGEIPRSSSLVSRALGLVAERIGPPRPEIGLVEELRGIPGAGDIRYLPDHLLGRKLFPPGLTVSVPPDSLFFVATAPAEGPALLAGYASMLANPRRRTSGGISWLTGDDPSLGPVTVAVRAGRLAGVKPSSGGEAERERLRLLLRLSPP